MILIEAKKYLKPDRMWSVWDIKNKNQFMAQIPRTLTRRMVICREKKINVLYMNSKITPDSANRGQEKWKKIEN